MQFWHTKYKAYRLKILLEGTQELLLFGRGLEATVAKLGGRIDKLERDLFESTTRGVGKQRLAESQDTLLDTNASTLDHDKVVVDDTIVREATKRSDSLVGLVKLGLGVGFVITLANAVDLLVDLSTVVVSTLTGTRDRVHDTRWMPGTDTSNLAETLVCLARQLLCSPTSSNTLESFTLGDSNDIDHLIGLEQIADGDLLLKVRLGPFDLVGDGATVDLNLHKVSLLLLERSLADLSVCKNADNGSVFLDTLELTSNRLCTLCMLLGITSESLSLGAVPVLVEATLDFVREMLSPDGGQRTEAAWGSNVADNADNDHWWGIDNGDSLYDFTLVHLGARTVEVTDNVGHTSLVADESGEVNWLVSLVLWPCLDAATV